ncbi:MAG: hypothetical protein FJ304_18700 [Planctomycetes bacterium]|nr:hypothetical protein [Planctomycetota bacterium]
MTAPLIVPTIEARYTAATLEKCARIQARQFVQVTYLTIATTLVAALIAARAELANMGNYSSFVLTVGVPCVAAIFAAWCGNQDSVIALLDSYCYALEQYGKEISTAIHVPSWCDVHDKWFRKSVVGRYWSNVAFGIALFGASLPGTLIIFFIGYKEAAILSQICVVAVIVIFRYIVLPPSRQPGNTTRYHIVTVVLFVAIVAMLLIFNHLSVRTPVAHRIDLPYHVLVSSSLASLLPLVVHILFESRRVTFLDGAVLDKSTARPVLPVEGITPRSDGPSKGNLPAR